MDVDASNLPLVAGHRALDLVNTIEPRIAGRPPERDHLAAPEALLVWASRAGLADEGELAEVARAWEKDHGAARAALAAVTDIRESLYAALAAVMGLAPADAAETGAALERLHTRWHAAVGRSMLRLEPADADATSAAAQPARASGGVPADKPDAGAGSVAASGSGTAGRAGSDEPAGAAASAARGSRGDAAVFTHQPDANAAASRADDAAGSIAGASGGELADGPDASAVASGSAGSGGVAASGSGTEAGFDEAAGEAAGAARATRGDAAVFAYESDSRGGASADAAGRAVAAGAGPPRGRGGRASDLARAGSVAADEAGAAIAVARVADPAVAGAGSSVPSGFGRFTPMLVVGMAPGLLLADRAVAAAYELLFSPDLARLGRCPTEEGGCGWLFLDHSRNRSRRWCRMADCGAEVKARKLTQRRRAARNN